MSTDRWTARFNATNWRISTFNGALLAAYFIPTWTIVAFKIAASPVHGFYERPNISVALYLSDTLRVAATDLTRFAWLLALGRLTVAAFFIVFLVQIARPAMRKAGECDEALGIALGIGSLISFVEHDDGVAGRRDRGASAARDRTDAVARHGNRVAG